MTSDHSLSFRCPSCEVRIESKYPPPIEPSCPYCGERMESAEKHSANRPKVYCPHCGSTASSYTGRQCAQCGGAWFAFTSETTARQDPDSAFRVESGPLAGRPQRSAQTSWPG